MTEAIRPLSRMEQLAGRTIVVSSAFLIGPVTPFVLQARLTGDRITVKYSAIRGDVSPRTVTVPLRRRLEDFVRQYCNIAIVGRITVVRGVRWHGATESAVRSALEESPPFGRASLRLPQGMTFEDLYPGLRELPRQSSAVTYVLGTLAEPSDPTASRDRVDEIKADYGELLTDVVYRIESSALFDSSVPLTKEFTLLLMQWDDEHRRLDGQALDALSRRISIAFDTARAHAETLGLNHLPLTARRPARRAVKAARLATEAVTEGERVAARTQLAKLLEGLRLHYLPSPSEAPLMVGGSRPALIGPGH